MPPESRKFTIGECSLPFCFGYLLNRNKSIPSRFNPFKSPSTQQLKMSISRVQPNKPQSIIALFLNILIVVLIQ